MTEQSAVKNILVCSDDFFHCITSSFIETTIYLERQTDTMKPLETAVIAYAKRPCLMSNSPFIQV